MLELAKERSIKAIGIVDHDTTEALDPILSEGKNYDIEIVPGIELSVCSTARTPDDKSTDEIHILGYFIDWHNKDFQAKLEFLRKARQERAMEMLNKLKNLNISIEQEDIDRIVVNKNTSVGRLHFARILLEKGYINRIPDAFRQYLGNGQPAYVPKILLPLKEAIETILNLGGIPVLAHPYYGNFDNFEALKELKEMGLMGVEVWHRYHSNKTIKNLKEIAIKLDLLTTGGTDCHGPLNGEPGIMGTLKIPYEILSNLKKALKPISAK